MKLTRFVIPVLLLVCGCGEVKEKESSGKLSAFGPAAQVDSLAAGVLEPGGPGLVVAVFKDGEMAFARRYGLANLDYGIPVTPATVFDVASISKQFTAASILILEQRGLLSLEDDIHMFVPEFPDYGHKIEIRRLLNHTSGVRDWVWLLTLGGVPFENAITRQDLFDTIYRQKHLAFEPGTDFAYSNSAFNLLALIVERAAGMLLSRFIDEEIFQPLGMTHSVVFDDRRLVIPNRALGYIPDTGCGWWMEHYFNPVFTGSSNIHTTVEDLLLWDRNFYSGKVGPAGMAAMMEKAGTLANGEAIRYGLGLWVGEYRGLRTAGHDGDWAGSQHYMLRFPDKKMTIAVLSNTHTFSPRRMCYQIADLCLAEWDGMAPPEKDSPPSGPAPVAVDPSLFDSYAGEFVAENGRTLSLRGEDDNLTVRFPGARKMTMLPLSETEFAQPDGGGRLVIIPGAAGGVDRLEWRGGQRTTVYYGSAFRFSKVDITGRQDEYAGEYRSGELNVTYRIEPSDKGLRLVTPIHSLYMMELTGITGNDPLWAEDENKLHFSIFEIAFRRNSRGKVTGFRLVHPWASLKLEFDKI